MHLFYKRGAILFSFELLSIGVEKLMRSGEDGRNGGKWEGGAHKFLMCVCEMS